MKDNKLEKPKPLRKIPTKKLTPKQPKNNFYWVYAIFIAAFLGFAIYSGSNTGVAIDFNRFENEMLLQIGRASCRERV